MIKRFSVKLLAAAVALWAAWQLAGLSDALWEASRQADALQKSLSTTEAAISELSGEDIQSLLKELGYVSRGDILFYDGG